IRRMRLSFVYFLLQFIVFYYFFFARKARHGLQEFYRRAFGWSGRMVAGCIRRNFFVFGQTLLDRIAFLAGQGVWFRLTFEHEDYLIGMREAGKGGILLSAHLGNWEMAGNLLKGRVTPTINIVMLDAEVEKIKNYLDEKTGGSRFR